MTLLDARHVDRPGGVASGGDHGRGGGLGLEVDGEAVHGSGGLAALHGGPGDLGGRDVLLVAVEAGPGLVLDVVGSRAPELGEGDALVRVEGERPVAGGGSVHVQGVAAGGYLLATEHDVAVGLEGRDLVLPRAPHEIGRASCRASV